LPLTATFAKIGLAGVNSNSQNKIFELNFRAMKPINIRDAIEQVPFKPFVLEVDNGKSLHVPHRDFIFLTPAGSTAVVVERSRDGEHTHIVDVDHVSMIKFDKKKAA
jgi:hypothetical protein